MRSRTAELEIAVMSDPAVCTASAWSEDSFARVIPRLSSETDEVDAFLYIFGTCRQLQTTCLDRRGIDCLIDGENVGRLPETVCRMLGLIVCELVRDASERAVAPRFITVMLRRRGAVCLCTISGQGAADPCADAKPGLRWVRQLAAELDGGCMIRSMPDRGIIAIMFNADLVEPRLPAAMRRYRAGTAERRASRKIPAVTE